MTYRFDTCKGFSVLLANIIVRKFLFGYPEVQQKPPFSATLAFRPGVTAIPGFLPGFSPKNQKVGMFRAEARDWGRFCTSGLKAYALYTSFFLSNNA